MEKPLIFFCDFDGTISKEDICYMMVKNYAREGWQEINSLWEQGVISTEECARKTLALLEVDPEELDRFFDSMELDNSFISFVEWVNGNNFPLYILSDGYDNYIEILLNRYNLNLIYYANHMDIYRSWDIIMPHQNLNCLKCGVCKTGLIKKLLKPGYTSVYVGDGYSDRCPVSYCDVVFAKNSLAGYCDEKGIHYYLYQDFNDIQKIITAKV